MTGLVLPHSASIFGKFLGENAEETESINCRCRHSRKSGNLDVKYEHQLLRESVSIRQQLQLFVICRKHKGLRHPFSEGLLFSSAYFWRLQP